jgi:hypothetical protein
MAPPVHKAIRDPKAFMQVIDGFIQSCTHDDTGKPLDKPILATLEGLSLATGVYHRQRWSEWLEKYSDGKYEGKPQRLIADAIKKVKLFSEQQLKQKCFSSNSGTSLALGKCMFNWIEQQHVKHEHSGGVNLVIGTGVPKPADTD